MCRWDLSVCSRESTAKVVKQINANTLLFCCEIYLALRASFQRTNLSTISLYHAPAGPCQSYTGKPTTSAISVLSRIHRLSTLGSGPRSFLLRNPSIDSALQLYIGHHLLNLERHAIERIRRIAQQMTPNRAAIDRQL